MPPALPAESRPHLRFDLDLPDGEGNELLKELEGIPVLALIIGRSLQRRAEAMRLGADEVLRTESVEKIALRWNGSSATRSITVF